MFSSRHNYTVIGTYMSPFVRKVLCTLHQNKIPYKIDPVLPFFAPKEFFQLPHNHFGQIPILRIDENNNNNNNCLPEFIPDSTVICEYLNETHQNELWKSLTPLQRAKSRYFEELADAKLFEAVIGKIWYQKSIRRFVLKEKNIDEDMIQEALNTDIPSCLDVLETELKKQNHGFLVSSSAPTTADFAFAAQMRNLELLKYSLFKTTEKQAMPVVDDRKFPRSFEYLKRIMYDAETTGIMSSLRKFEEVSARNPPASVVTFLKEEGAPISEISRLASSPTPSVWQAPMVSRTENQ